MPLRVGRAGAPRWRLRESACGGPTRIRRWPAPFGAGRDASRPASHLARHLDGQPAIARSRHQVAWGQRRPAEPARRRSRGRDGRDAGEDRSAGEPARVNGRVESCANDFIESRGDGRPGAAAARVDGAAAIAGAGAAGSGRVVSGAGTAAADSGDRVAPAASSPTAACGDDATAGDATDVSGRPSEGRSAAGTDTASRVDAGACAQHRPGSDTAGGHAVDDAAELGTSQAGAEDRR